MRLEDHCSLQSLVPLRNSELDIHELDGEIVVYDPRRGRVHVLNKVAAFILNECDGSKTVERLVEVVTRRFSGAEAGRVTSDVLKALQRFREEQLVSEAGARGASPAS